MPQPGCGQDRSGQGGVEAAVQRGVRESVVFTLNVTHALNIAMHGPSGRVISGDHQPGAQLGDTAATTAPG